MSDARDTAEEPDISALDYSHYDADNVSSLLTHAADLLKPLHLAALAIRRGEKQFPENHHKLTIEEYVALYTALIPAGKACVKLDEALQTSISGDKHINGLRNFPDNVALYLFQSRSTLPNMPDSLKKSLEEFRVIRNVLDEYNGIEQAIYTSPILRDLIATHVLTQARKVALGRAEGEDPDWALPVSSLGQEIGNLYASTKQQTKERG